MSVPEKKIGPTVTVTEARPRTSSSSSVPSLKSPRTARFAEATSVNSPIEPLDKSRSPFADPVPPTNHYQPQAQPSDIGFGYMADNDPSKHAMYPQAIEMEETDPNYLAPATPGPMKSPLKSAMKSPGAKSFGAANPLSPTFREEQILEKHEESTEKVQAKDLVSGPIRCNGLFKYMADVRIRKSNSEYGLPKCFFAVSTSAAVSSSCLCCLPPSQYSTQQRLYLREVPLPLGHQIKRFGRRFSSFVSRVSHSSFPLS